MEHLVLNILHAAAWLFAFIFLFAIIGIIAVVRWIMNLVMGTERAVSTGVHNVENSLHRRE
ncbi:MAG: hypothetical protein M3126_04440 [Candidatus Eremiobacteraeota bacterium]|nr:hypothetical protein [Candidatus Eremiobacteraeota bacterium]